MKNGGNMINDKVVLAKGVSSGIGRETAQLLAERGARVFGSVRDFRGNGDLPNVEPVHMDVTDDASVRDGVKSGVEEAGKIEILINNAGYGLTGALEETSIEEAQQQFDTNFFGVLRVTQAALPAMRRQRSGRIVDALRVAEVIYRAATEDPPRLHYPGGEGITLTWLRRFVPVRMFDRTFRKRFQLDEPLWR
jgi:NAD(P)-dependent dehydrogenase (short-subunit alcohol dehydrogenase family)